jgi:hypothetical protein
MEETVHQAKVKDKRKESQSANDWNIYRFEIWILCSSTTSKSKHGGVTLKSPIYVMKIDFLDIWKETKANSKEEAYLVIDNARNHLPLMWWLVEEGVSLKKPTPQTSTPLNTFGLLLKAYWINTIKTVEQATVSKSKEPVKPYDTMNRQLRNTIVLEPFSLVLQPIISYYYLILNKSRHIQRGKGTFIFQIHNKSSWIT